MTGTSADRVNRHDPSPRRAVPPARAVQATAGARAAGVGVAAAIAAGVIALTVPAGARAAAPPGSCESARTVAGALPAVINITTVLAVADKDVPSGAHFELSAGSGYIIDPSGVIVTNKHVIKDAARIMVTFADRAMAPAQLIGAAPGIDVAVLKVTMPHPLPTLAFGDSDAVQPGQPVFAIGNPLGLGMSVSSGVISARGRNLMRTPFDEFIQTDASINPGNSGGPLIDCAGRVVGMDSALISNTATAQGSIGIGFAMPANDVATVVGLLRAGGAVQPNWIGLHTQDLTRPLTMVFGASGTSGAIVTEVDPDSPAAAASMAPGDIITRVNGKDLPNARAVLIAITETPSGKPISLDVLRGGRTVETTVRGVPWPHWGALRSEVLASPEIVAKAKALGLGLHLTALTPADREHYGMGNMSGVLVDRVDAQSQAYGLGYRVGDVITKVGTEPATTPDQVMAALTRDHARQGGFVALLIWRTDGPRWMYLYLGEFDVAALVAPEPAAVPAQNAAAKRQP